jgi:signal transduction histidine kinase
MGTDLIHSGKAKQEPDASPARSGRLAAIGGLADEIAHDFNNVLSGILGLNEIVMTRCLPPGSPALGYLEEIADAGGRAKKLVSRLGRLAISARESRDVCHLGEILDAVIPPLSATLPEGARMTSRLHWKTAEISADEAQIQRLVLNLLAHAIHALDHGPGEIVVSLTKATSPGELPTHLGQAREGTFAQLVVADTGREIPSEILARVLDPGFASPKRLDRAAASLFEAFRIARLCGAEVAGASDAGRGSVFTVYLPATGTENAAHHAGKLA